MSADGQLDCVVIGAGVVGLAIARAMALKGRDVVVLEATGSIGSETSSRNSEVIHAGIYYPEGSLKARFCVEGRQLLYAYCASRGIGHQRCGKLIVATSQAQAAALASVMAKGLANGVDGLTLLTRAEARRMEPALECIAAVLSPDTGIVDSHALMLAMQGDLENAGGAVVLRSPVVGATFHSHGITLDMQDSTRVRAQTVINAAGLHAPALARCFQGLDERHIPRAWFAKGNYFTLAGRSPFSRLIYPVPEPDSHLAGLGVHLTIDLGGQAKFGPDVQWVDSPDDLLVDASRGAAFYAEVRRYWPALKDGALTPGYAGIRPKISAPGAPASDFMIQGPADHGVDGLVNLFGIESPGLTSSLAIGRYVAAMV